jgi:hypothetical protein
VVAALVAEHRVRVRVQVQVRRVHPVRGGRYLARGRRVGLGRWGLGALLLLLGRRLGTGRGEHVCDGRHRAEVVRVSGWVSEWAVSG